MVNSIAVDITNKHRRRFQRQKELQTIRQTLSNLDEKRSFLDESKETYLAYIDSCMNQLSSKNSRRRSRLVIPFTRQYNHLRDLHRSGRVPEFGSYVYTAKQLYDKGVLLSIEGVSPKQFDRIKLTISSNATGEFKIEASLQALGVGVPGKEVMDLRFEDLLVCQFNGVLVMSLFEGAAKVNVNLLIFLVNKKFYT
jgi:Ras GTPase-activating-like protein IQGAP2/3